VDLSLRKRALLRREPYGVCLPGGTRHMTVGCEGGARARVRPLALALKQLTPRSPVRSCCTCCAPPRALYGACTHPLHGRNNSARAGCMFAPVRHPSSAGCPPTVPRPPVAAASHPSARAHRSVPLAVRAEKLAASSPSTYQKAAVRCAGLQRA
jgi:hypothetical protein